MTRACKKAPYDVTVVVLSYRLFTDKNSNYY